MARGFELEIELDYNTDTPYNDILWKNDWVRGFTVTFTFTITNKSQYVFPGTTIKVILEEHSSLRETDLVRTYSPLIEIPELEPNAYIVSAEHEYTPRLEGMCEIVLASPAFKRKEVVISGSMQRTAVQTRISSLFTVIGWQELEIIQLLRKIVNRKD